jgi:hypothetical protein
VSYCLVACNQDADIEARICRPFDVMPSSLVDIHIRFGGTYSVHFQVEVYSCTLKLVPLWTYTDHYEIDVKHLVYFCDMWTHCTVTVMKAGYSLTAIAKEQLCGHVVSPSVR